MFANKFELGGVVLAVKELKANKTGNRFAVSVTIAPPGLTAEVQFPASSPLADQAMKLGAGQVVSVTGTIGEYNGRSRFMGQSLKAQ